MSTTSSALNPGTSLSAAAVLQGWGGGSQTANAPSLLARVGTWFRRSSQESAIERSEGAADVQEDRPASTGQPRAEQPQPPVRPPAPFMVRGKRPGPNKDLRKGVSALTELTSAVRDDLKKQNERHEQLMRYLSHLPKIIAHIPEAARLQGEAIKAIHNQMERQAAQHAAQQATYIEQRSRDAAAFARQSAEQASRHEAQQARLASILEGLTCADAARGEAVSSLAQQVEALRRQELVITHGLSRFGDDVAQFGANLADFGVVVQTAAQTSQVGAQIIADIREDLGRRESTLEKAIHRNNTRFTSMLAVAITVSVAAMTSVVVIGYLMLSRIP
jgi:hypothetical protein